MVDAEVTTAVPHSRRLRLRLWPGPARRRWKATSAWNSSTRTRYSHASSPSSFDRPQKRTRQTMSSAYWRGSSMSPVTDCSCNRSIFPKWSASTCSRTPWRSATKPAHRLLDHELVGKYLLVGGVGFHGRERNARKRGGPTASTVLAWRVAVFRVRNVPGVTARGAPHERQYPAWMETISQPCWPHIRASVL